MSQPKGAVHYQFPYLSSATVTPLAASSGPQTRIEPRRNSASQGEFIPCQVEFIPCQVEINSLQFPATADKFSLLGRNSLPVRAAENAVSQPFATPCGFRMRRGER